MQENDRYALFSASGGWIEKKPIFRERVYCYELYHQLRNVLGDDFRYKLDGEVDKSGHPLFPPELARVKPDFIVHDPGNMKNLVAVEVKSIEVSDYKLRRDVWKLKKLLEMENGYYKAIFLIYGDSENTIPEKIIKKVKKLIKGYEDRILLIWHPGPGKEPKILNDPTH